MKCLIPTTEPSDSHRPRTLFLGPRKERQGFKNKVTDKGGLHSGSSLLKTSSRPGTTILGLLQSNLEKVSTDSFPFKKKKKNVRDPTVSFRVCHNEGNQGNRINLTSRKSLLSPISFCFPLIERLICYLPCLCWTHPTYHFQIYLFDPPQRALSLSKVPFSPYSSHSSAQLMVALCKLWRVENQSSRTLLCVCVSVKTLTAEPGVVVHSFNPRSWEAEAGESLW